MIKVRIDFTKAGAVTNSYTAEVPSRKAAEALADQIASGISSDGRVIIEERKCVITLRNDAGKACEMLETKAFDEADANRIAALWAKRTGKSFTSAAVLWRQL